MKTIEYLKSYGGRDKYFQRVKDLRAGDCVVRACAHATGLEYFQVMQRLFELLKEAGVQFIKKGVVLDDESKKRLLLNQQSRASAYESTRRYLS